MQEVTCNKCGWVHMGLTPDAYLNLSPVHDQYMNCWNCGNSYKDFRPAVEADAPAGVTLQPIMEYKSE